MAFGMAAVATPLTELILGAKWTDSAQYVALYALVGAVQFALGPLGTLLLVRGKTHTITIVMWTEFAVFLVAAFALVPFLHLLGLVWARLLAAVVSALVTAWNASHYCSLTMRQTAQAIGRPLVGAMLMHVVVVAVMERFSSGVLQLCFGVAVGAATFAVWSLLTWRIVGRPEGLESTLLDALGYWRSRGQSA
jgi:O-antigen/teichoic acid export membrane protein